ncbi:conserved exported protein of unknown function [Nitrospira sp. KM1]|uniref:hypothetical protein n=1 Tax=Nitrospira sp. KM1 TaxID=1936990 RepID=UPI0013A786D5|nr:hypothetical protein [Nitrospira sp. KM1]BCA56646.1 conserved exported protein of unknown function [Nitrospira sp. KM1]
MTASRLYLLLLILAVGIPGCAGQSIPHEPDVIDVVLPAPSDKVKMAVIEVLSEGGYTVREDAQRLTTDYREEMAGPWDWLLRWRLGTVRSRVEATVTADHETTSHLYMSVLYEGKDGILTRWDTAPTALPQSAEHQLRLIKNTLRIL